MFDYSGKVILTIKDFQKNIENKLERVWKLKGNGSWIVSKQVKGQLWESEVITLVKVVGKKPLQKLPKWALLQLVI